MHLAVHERSRVANKLWQRLLFALGIGPLHDVLLTKLQEPRLEMLSVDMHFVEHLHRLFEHSAVQVATRAISVDQVAGAVDDAWVELCVLEDDGAEEVYRDFAERLMSWEQVGAVEIAKDPIEVFLYFVSMPASSSA